MQLFSDAVKLIQGFIISK